jgi:lambda repressor-like predicted transcriptional regulator
MWRDRVRRYGHEQLQDADYELLDDADFMAYAIKYDALAFAQASPRLRSDPAFVVEALRADGRVLRSSAFETGLLDTSLEVFFAAVAVDVDVMTGRVSDEQMDDKAFVLRLVNANGWAFYSVSERLKRDPEFVIAAVERNWAVFKTLSLEARNNIEVVKALIRNNPKAARLVPDVMQYNREVVLELVRIDGVAILYMEKAGRDAEVMRVACASNGAVYPYLYASLSGRFQMQVAAASADKQPQMQLFAVLLERVFVMVQRALFPVVFSDEEDVDCTAIEDATERLDTVSVAFEKVKDSMDDETVRLSNSRIAAITRFLGDISLNPCIVQAFQEDMKDTMLEREAKRQRMETALRVATAAMAA